MECVISIDDSSGDYSSVLEKFIGDTEEDCVYKAIEFFASSGYEDETLIRYIDYIATKEDPFFRLYHRMDWGNKIHIITFDETSKQLVIKNAFSIAKKIFESLEERLKVKILEFERNQKMKQYESLKKELDQ